MFGNVSYTSDVDLRNQQMPCFFTFFQFLKWKRRQTRIENANKHALKKSRNSLLKKRRSYWLPIWHGNSRLHHGSKNAINVKGKKTHSLNIRGHEPCHVLMNRLIGKKTTNWLITFLDRKEIYGEMDGKGRRKEEKGRAGWMYSSEKKLTN